MQNIPNVFFPPKQKFVAVKPFFSRINDKTDKNSVQYLRQPCVEVICVIDFDLLHSVD